MISFEELKRRNVFRVAAAYLLISWLIVQIADLVLNNIGAPSWVIQTLFFLLGIGFVLAVVFSWVYELTPEGIKRERDVVRDNSITGDTGRKLDYVTIAAAVGVALMFVWDKVVDDSPAPTAEVVATPAISSEKTIAVLPFENMSADADNEYFSDGITEELLNVLVRINGLQVASRTSAFSFKGQQADIPTIANALQVDHIVEGSVRRAGNQVRITAQLIDARSDRHLWSDTYTGELDDVFELQDRIATEIANALELELLGDTSARRTDDIEAHDLYLLGRHEFHLRTPESLERAIELFERAIEIDPEYALAYSGLADSYSLIFQYGSFDQQTATERAEANARKAVELAPDLAEAHASLGLALSIQFLFEEGREEYLKAIELNPDYSMAWMWMGTALWSKPQEALEAFQMAERVDPLHPVVLENVADALSLLGRFDESAERYDQAIAMHPDSTVLLFSRSGMEAERGRFDDAYRFARQAIAGDPDAPYALEAMILSELQLGNAERAGRWLAKFREVAPKNLSLQWLYPNYLDARGEYAAVLDYVAEVRADRPRQHAPFLALWEGYGELRLGRPERALQAVADVQRQDIGAPNYLVVLVQRSYAHWLLGNEPLADAAALDGLRLVEEMHSNQFDQPWIRDVESVFLSILGRTEEAIAALNRAYDQGHRDVHIISSLWMQDQLLEDEPRYHEIKQAMIADVERQQQDIEDEIARCELTPDECTLVAIDGP